VVSEEGTVGREGLMFCWVLVAGLFEVGGLYVGGFVLLELILGD